MAGVCCARVAELLGMLSHHRHAVLAFAAASQKNKPVPTVSTGAALQGHEWDVLSRRGAQMLHDQPWLSNAAGQLRSQVRGAGIPRSAQNDGANESWATWSASCGYRHGWGSYPAIEGVLINETIKDGIGFVRRVQGRANVLNPNGLLLQSLSWRDVDQSRGELGVEYLDNQIRGIHFRAQSTIGIQMSFESVFVDIRDLVILRLRLESDQLAGLPSYTAAMKDATLADMLSGAEMRAAQTRAAITAFATAPPSLDAEYVTMGPTITGPHGEPVNQVSPNTVVIARGVDDIKFPPGSDNAINHRNAASRTAAGCGTTIQAIGGDASDASFSALRWAALMMSSRGKLFATDTGFPEARAKILEWFMLAELLHGRDHAANGDPRWAWTPAENLDVDQLQQARALRLFLGGDPSTPIISMAQARQKLGIDPDVTQDQIDRQPQPTPMTPDAIRAHVEREMGDDRSSQQAA